jgi:hypothetical protein
MGSSLGELPAIEPGGGRAHLTTHHTLPEVPSGLQGQARRLLPHHASDHRACLQRRVLPAIRAVGVRRLPVRQELTNPRTHPSGVSASRTCTRPSPEGIGHTFAAGPSRFPERPRRRGKLPQLICRLRQDFNATRTGSPIYRDSGRVVSLHVCWMVPIVVCRLGLRPRTSSPIA